VLASPGLAAEDLKCTCVPDPTCVQSDDSLGVAWLGWRRDQVIKRLQPLRLAGHWSAAVDTLTSFFVSHSGGVSDSSRVRVLRQLGALRSEAWAFENGYAAAPRVSLRRFSIDFEDEDHFVVFEDPADAVDVRTRDGIPNARAVCWTVLAAKDLAWAMTSDERRKALVYAQARVARWDNLRTKGYTQFPLEMLVNGLMHEGMRARKHDLEPVPWQVVLMHPSVGTQMIVDRRNLKRTDDWRRQDVGVVELAGLLVYRDQFKKYCGASWVATFPSNDSPGMGVLVHLGKNLEVGPVWKRGASDKLAVMASLDVRQWLSAAPATVTNWWEQAKARLALDELKLSKVASP
jgi:hypothetical protein